MHLGKYKWLTHKIILFCDIITCMYPNCELNHLVNICIVSYQYHNPSMSSGNTSDNKSMKFLLRNVNSRALNHQRKRRASFKAKKVPYMQASKDRWRMHNVDNSSSDNDEDFNKMTSTYPSKRGHSLTP
jgi:hypothetical protein